MKLMRIYCHSEQGQRFKIRLLKYHPELLSIYKQMGIIDIEEGTICHEDLHRLQKILRLKRNCGVNTVGAAIIVDLLEKVEDLQDEIETLRRK
jgi:MerR family transcriptional regulator, heat shock protein HspR